MYRYVCWWIWDAITGAALLENNAASAELTTANGGTFTWAQLDSVANHVTARSISDWRALTWLVTETGWARRKRSAICCGKLISVHMIPHDVIKRYDIYMCKSVDAIAADERMTSDSDVRRAISSSNMSIEMTFTGLRPNDEYNISIAVNMRFGLAQSVSIAATTTGELL